jgi:hypothetical protein
MAAPDRNPPSVSRDAAEHSLPRETTVTGTNPSCSPRRHGITSTWVPKAPAAAANALSAVTSVMPLSSAASAMKPSRSGFPAAAC